MSGEMDIGVLLASMNPVIEDEIYVFVTLTTPYDVQALDPILQFREAEGMTLIMRKDTAEKHDIPFVFESRKITLNVHSSLEAVGFIAAISKELTRNSIGANPVAGYFHDHLFIEVEKAEAAMACLKDLIRSHS